MSAPMLSITQQWHRDFDAPVIIARTAGESGCILAADDEGALYLIDRNGRLVWSKQLSFLPSALAIDATGRRIVAAADSGTLVVFDQDEPERVWERLIFQPVSLDLTPTGSRLATADAGGNVALINPASGARETMQWGDKYRYVRFLKSGAALLAVGQYGQVVHLSLHEDKTWQKDFRCNTRSPSVSEATGMILVPAPHFGIIALDASGREMGLFEVPGGPRCVAISPVGDAIFVVNEDSDLFVFEPDGKVLFRENASRGIMQLEVDSIGTALTAVTTCGAVERLLVSPRGAAKQQYLEFSRRGKAAGRPSGSTLPSGPVARWRTKVFSAIGGVRGGELVVTPRARHVALLDVEARLRIFDSEGRQSGVGEPIRGYQPMLKASPSHDIVVAASSETLFALDLRSHTQRRYALKNDWATHFALAPNAVFMAVADFFRGVSLYGSDLTRCEFFETDSDVCGIAVDGKCHTLVALDGGKLAIYDRRGSLISTNALPTRSLMAIQGLSNGFVVADGRTVYTFTTKGEPGWSLDAQGEIVSVQPTPGGHVIVCLEGGACIVNPQGAVAGRMPRRGRALYFGAPDNAGEILSIESHARLLTVRSSEKRVLWRREIDDDITAMALAPDGAWVALIAGIYLYLMATTAGPWPAEDRFYLEI